MAESSQIEQFSGRKYVNLESFRRNGQPKLTPVQFIGENGVLFLRTDPGSWKLKRIQKNPNVRVVPSDRNGKPAGSWVKGSAHVLSGAESDMAMSLFKREYGKVGISLINFIGGSEAIG